MRVRIDKLCLAVRDDEIVSVLAKRFAGPFRVKAATIGLYPHPNGVAVADLPGRYWVYIRLLDERGEPVYDVAMWKALSIPEVRRRLAEHGAIEEAGGEVASVDA